MPLYPVRSVRASEYAEERRSAELSFAADFSLALLNPKIETPAGIMGPNEKAAIKRYNVYRNNVTVSLIGALAAIYPAVQRMTGVEGFRAMARFHMRAHPPTSPLLFEYGREFPEFIKHCEYAQSMPWLSDTARIERAWLDAYHAADAEVLTPQTLVAIPPSRLADTVFVPHPATRIVRSEFSAVSIFVANRSDGPAEAVDTAAPEEGLITRPEQEVVVRRLPAGAAEFLTVLVSGEPFGAAASAAFEACASFDLPTNIVGMIEAGVFTAVQFGDSDDNY
jgi:Putative DNA-binding domain